MLALPDWCRRVAEQLIVVAARFGAFEAGRDAMVRARVRRFMDVLMHLPVTHRDLPGVRARPARIAPVEVLAHDDSPGVRAARVRVAQIERFR